MDPEIITIPEAAKLLRVIPQGDPRHHVLIRSSHFESLASNQEAV